MASVMHQDLAVSGGDPPKTVQNLERRKKTISNPHIHRMQKRHFLLFDVLPAIGTLGAILTLPWLPFGLLEVALFFAMWLLTGVGITVGYHRLFTHRSFKAETRTRALLAILGSMAGQGGVISWAALHRRHHEFSDTPGDPHSPNLQRQNWAGRLRGLLHAHFTWMVHHEYPSTVHYTPDLLRDKTIVRIDQLYYHCVAVGFWIPAAIGGAVHESWSGLLSGLLWGGAVRMFVLGHIIWSINSFLHTVGSRLFETKEHSHNGPWFSLVTLGESWHNNHHAFPSSAWFGLAWYRFDPGYWCIRLLERLHLAHEVRVPTQEAVRTRQNGETRSSPQLNPT